MAQPSSRRLGVLAHHMRGPETDRAPEKPLTAPAAGAEPHFTGAVIGLGWMGMLYDLAQRVTEVTQEMVDRGDFEQSELGRRFEQDDTTRPTPELQTHRRFQHNEHVSPATVGPSHLATRSPEADRCCQQPGDSGLPSTYAEALHDREMVSLVAAADRDANRLAAFKERFDPPYGSQAVSTYTDAAEMLAAERPDIVAIATNTVGRAELTALAVAHGAKCVLTDKPMAHSLAEADLMVESCAEAGVPLCCGSISTTHPSFERAKILLREGAIGDLISIEASSPGAQHQVIPPLLHLACRRGRSSPLLYGLRSVKEGR